MHDLVTCKYNKTCRRTGKLACNCAFPLWSILKSYIYSYQTWFKSIKGFAETDTVKIKHKKSVTLTLRPCTGMGMVLHKILDKALSSRHKWIKSIEGFKKQVAQRATIAHLSPMCQGQISFQKTYKWAMETKDLKSNSSEILCLSWLPATLMMIRSKMIKLAWRHHFPITSLWEMF